MKWFWQRKHKSAKHGDDLLKAAQAGDLPQVRTVLAKGADVNHQWTDGRTALMFAANHGHEAVVKLSLEKGATINHQDDEGWLK